ncbi:Phospho-2-dehydro-3-deoxyheptonate aldolase class II [Penicillium vulpinum]|uniref:Phospho-2-dehydro-3-deoxyheptonate aldolase class II n=1 Tax=Penicillium vulpinum TaxID=29845 RepID=UPI0025468A5F|nr:Phospho-2-dehydro-3-deoxyheptonate aldolase class II [Penicillium vulpinum]KAJ5960206.1 Phospho-2-dehydro-3-deoxyheptonate aldolase class II [Penicillium vulpinum]
MAEWSPSSWTQKPIKQDVIYEDLQGLKDSLQKLQKLPPLVTTQEINNLKKSLRNVALGKAFVLQGGDCAELFDYCSQEMIEAKVKLLLQMSLVLIWGANKPVIRIARIAGQFAKSHQWSGNALFPRRQHQWLPSRHQIPPTRPITSSLSLLPLRGNSELSPCLPLLRPGRPALPLDWGLGHVITPSIKEQYTKIVGAVKDALRFMHTVGIDKDRGFETADIFTSHEGLSLEYEQSLTRLLRHPAYPGSTAAPETGYYATSGHFIWIGDRTRQLGGAHVEFFRGIANPVGIKIGPSMKPDELVQLLDVVNPDREIGKVTLISRYGAAKIADFLPGHIAAVQASGHIPVWQCDPMHGNTQSTPSGVKTRHFTDILSELKQALEIHRAAGSFLGGMHLELTGEAVTECVGGAAGLTEEGLGERYTTFCDPRLNEKQALELAFLVAGFYREESEE